MKNVFACNFSADGEVIDGAPLIDRRISEELAAKLEAYEQGELEVESREPEALNAAYTRAYELLWQEIMTELDAPADGEKIDVLGYYYRNRSKKPPRLFENSACCIFTEGSRLFLAGERFRISLEFSAIRRFRHCMRTVKLAYWNKTTPVGEGVYADVRKGWFDTYIIPGYAVLEFTESGEDYEIWIPCYDVPAVEALIGMKAENSTAE